MYPRPARQTGEPTPYTINSTTRVDAVIFDMDGLMFDTERIAQLGWQQAAREYGYDFPVETYAGIIGLTQPDVQVYVRQVFGSSFPFQDVYQLKQAYVDIYITNQGIPVKAGLHELMDRLEKIPLPMALASSSMYEVILRNLRAARLDRDRFATIVAGDEIVNGKPAPDIFLEAAKRLRVAPAHCLVLEDSNTGIQAAHAAGMLPVMVPDMKPPTVDTATYAFRVLTDLQAVRRELFSSNGC
jgi:HAD superfamily hydrolase (TIGR01509 family)